MENYNTEIQKYNFHDSRIDFIHFEQGDTLSRRLVIQMQYYNWEDNIENNTEWNWKVLKLSIDHCFLLRYEFPDIIENGFEISHIETQDDFELIQNAYFKKKPNIYFNILKDKIFRNCMSIKFFTHDGFGDPIFGENIGFLWVAGFDANIELSDSDITGKIHISPIGKET